MLLDLSAAFNLVDHGLLIDVMQHRFGVCGSALEWLADVLTDRTQIVRVGDSESATLTLKYGVPQGSVTDPKRFIQYTEDATLNLTEHDLSPHLFADDTQGMLHCLPASDGLETKTRPRRQPSRPRRD